MSATSMERSIDTTYPSSNAICFPNESSSDDGCLDDFIGIERRETASPINSHHPSILEQSRLWSKQSDLYRQVYKQIEMWRIELSRQEVAVKKERYQPNAVKYYVRILNAAWDYAQRRTKGADLDKKIQIVKLLGTIQNLERSLIAGLDERIKRLVEMSKNDESVGPQISQTIITVAYRRLAIIQHYKERLDAKEFPKRLFLYYHTALRDAMNFVDRFAWEENSGVKATMRMLKNEVEYHERVLDGMKERYARGTFFDELSLELRDGYKKRKRDADGHMLVGTRRQKPRHFDSN
ncbi:hypothetical protein H0H93_006588 [Arthromyces matolae]|nr:hypothetical protein H0H93_006588 [Arthromyces matolae]